MSLHLALEDCDAGEDRIQRPACDGSAKGVVWVGQAQALEGRVQGGSGDGVLLPLSGLASALDLLGGGPLGPRW